MVILLEFESPYFVSAHKLDVNMSALFPGEHWVFQVINLSPLVRGEGLKSLFAFFALR
jgi:hypothetical protein